MGYKCKPITERAKSSPFKMNMALVYGAGDMSKKFVDAASSMGEGMESSSYSSKPMRTIKSTADDQTSTGDQTSTDDQTTNNEETTTNEE